MRVEKEIKRQAREALRGNHSKLLAAIGVTAAAMLLLEHIEYLVLLATGLVNGADDSVVESLSLPLVLVTAGYLAVVLLASPLINGCLRMASDVALNKRCSSKDVFRYFRDPRLWAKTVLINLLLSLLYGVLSGALDVSGYLSVLMPAWSDLPPSFSVETYLTVLAGVVTVLIRIVLYMLFVHYPLHRYALDDSIGAVDCVFLTLPFSLRHFGQLFRLIVSFAGWLALCFFVVPALYVLPYFAVACATSAKWLFAITDNGGEE